MSYLMNPVWDSIVWSCKSQIIGNLSLVFCLTVGEQKTDPFLGRFFFSFFFFVSIESRKPVALMTTHWEVTYKVPYESLFSNQSKISNVEPCAPIHQSPLLGYFSSWDIRRPKIHWEMESVWITLLLQSSRSLLSSCSDPFPQEPSVLWRHMEKNKTEMKCPHLLTSCQNK